MRPVCDIMHAHIDLDLRLENLIDFAGSHLPKPRTYLNFIFDILLGCIVAIVSQAGCSQIDLTEG